MENSGLKPNERSTVERPVLPIPDYETLFPKKRHGVMGQTRWDNIIAEVNHRRMNKSLNCSEAAMSASGLDESKVTCPPPVSHQSTLALQETLSESSDKNTGPSSKKALQPLKPILSDRNVDVSTKQAHLPPKPVFPDKVVGTSSEQALQSPKPVSPWQTVEVTPMTRNVPVTPTVAKSFKAPNTVLMSALENIQKRDSRYKKTEQKGNDKKAFGSVSDRLKKKPVSTSTVLSDTSPTGVIKTERDAQLGPLVNSKPVMPIQNTQASNTDMSFKDDPFPGDQLLSHDPWQLPQKNMSGEMFLMKEDEKTYLSERHDDFVKTFASDPQIDPFSHDSKSDLTGPSKHNEPVEIISPTPQISPKKRRAPLPPMTSSSIDSKAKLERHTRESCRESDIKTNDILENSISSIISEEQGNAEDMDISSVTEPASTKTDFVESSSKQQVEFMGKLKHSQTSSSAEKHPQANSKRLMSALENAQKRNLTVIKPAATERVLDTKSANLVEQNKSTEVISKVVTPTPQVTPKKRLAPLPPVTSSHSRIKTKPENCLELSDVTTKDDLLLDNSNSPTSNEEQKNAGQIDISSDSMETDTKTTTAATSKQQVEAEHSQTSQPQPDEPGGTQQEKDVHQTAMTPATEILTLKEDNQTDFIDVETADTQDPFPSDAIPDKGPWNIPEPSTHDDCLITDETETKKTEVVDGCLNLDIKADSFSDNCSEIVSEQNKAMPIIDSGTPVHQNLSKKPISSSPVSSMCTGNSEIDSDEQMSEPNHTLHPIPLNATVVVTPNEEPMNTEPLDTSLPIQPEAFLTEEAEAIGITPNHKEMVMKPADETLKEMEVIPIIDSQHVTICQIVSLENAPDVDTENIEYDPSPSGAVLSYDPGNLLHDKNDNDNVAHSTKEKINVKETGLSPNELDRNCETDIPTDPLSVSSHSDFIMYSEQKTVEIIPDNNLSTPILSKQHQDPLHHGSPSTLYVSKPDTPETSSDVSRQITDPGKEENASLAIATTSVKDTLIDISQIQQDKMYPIPNLTKSSPPVDHLSHMNVHVTEIMSKTNSEKYSRGPIPHALKPKTFSPSPSFSAPTMTPSDAHWDSDSEESLICVSTNTARSPHQNRYDNYISSTISLSPKVPELHLASTGEGSSSKPTPEDTGKSLQWEPSAGILDAVLGEDTTVVRPKESIFSPLSAGAKPPVYAWISPLGVQAGVPDGIGLELASSPLRPHPVKPLSAQESQHPGSSSVAVSKDLKSISITDMPEKLKRTGSGPYTQLTQEELITLVVKQQTELTKRDEKIVELEEYIDNLLVRVIEEQPSILMSLAAAKGSH
ncbi:mucin-17 isoform X1 [Sardina pilchardus]|uniref:mucin-17 isoform X1 n=1 Tax=Sardina pilchardus TaxID=27697 RepID=UPI002E10B95F